MSLRDDILSAPRGTQARLIEKTGLTKPTVIKALHGRACSAATAQELAKAFGKPKRWHELVIVHRRKRREPVTSADHEETSGACESTDALGIPA